MKYFKVTIWGYDEDGAEKEETHFVVAVGSAAACTHAKKRTGLEIGSYQVAQTTYEEYDDERTIRDSMSDHGLTREEAEAAEAAFRDQTHPLNKLITIEPGKVSRSTIYRAIECKKAEAEAAEIEEFHANAINMYRDMYAEFGTATNYLK